jgi:tRNA C32,U32 (ribose-2'-O)-methylase TrmJ
MSHKANAIIDCPECGSWHTVIVEGEDVWSICGCGLDDDGFESAYVAASEAERIRNVENIRRQLKEAIDCLSRVIADSKESTAIRSACMSARSEAIQAMQSLEG